MVEAVRTRERFRREGTVAAWLWRAVVRTALKHRARVRLVSPLDEDAAVERPGHDASLDVRGLVARLPERQRLALFLRYYGGLEYAEIASALDVKVGTISATLNAAHTALRSAVEEVGHVGHP
jgi:RNA polymerase sigma-70 factor (ECF subfamily)